MLLNFVEPYHSRAVAALDAKAVDNFFYHATGASYLNILVAHRAVPIKNQPVFNAELAEEFVAVVALLCFAAHL